jgi:hypothetical protein
LPLQAHINTNVHTWILLISILCWSQTKRPLGLHTMWISEEEIYDVQGLNVLMTENELCFL